MKTFTIDDIRSWRPCYDPNRHLPEDWSGTVIDILKHDTISPQDKLWVVCREKLIDAKTLRLFAVRCARQVEHLMTDDRSKSALIVAERFAHGEATRDELDAAWDAAGSAAGSAAWDAAWAAAWDAQIARLIEMLEGRGGARKTRYLMSLNLERHKIYNVEEAALEIKAILEEDIGNAECYTIHLMRIDMTDEQFERRRLED